MATIWSLQTALYKSGKSVCSPVINVTMKTSALNVLRAMTSTRRRGSAGEAMTATALSATPAIPALLVVRFVPSAST